MVFQTWSCPLDIVVAGKQLLRAIRLQKYLIVEIIQR
jgi:hypothetical protein